MYATPQTMTLRELLIRLSERFGVADYSGTTPAPVADTHTLDRFKRGINDAVLELAARHKWTWLRPHAAITLSTDGTSAECVDDSPVQYRLPEWAQSQPVGNVNWESPDATYGGFARTVHMDVLRQYRASRGSEKGPPAMVAVALHETSQPAGKVPRHVLHVWPVPDVAHVIRPRFRRQPSPMVGDYDVGCWNPSQDVLVLEYAACVLAESGVTGGPEASTQRAKVEGMLQAHIALDGEFAGASLGQMSSGQPANSYIDRSPVSVNGTVIIES